MDLFTLVGKIVLESDEFNSRVDAVMSKAESLANGFQKAGDKVAQIGSGMTKAVTLPLAAAGGASVSMAASFEDAMLKVQSLSGASQEEYAQLTAAAKEYGATTAWTAKDVADAMCYMALAGFDTKEILASIGGMLSLASASGEDLAAVTDILTDSMTAFGDEADDASRYADVLATTQAKSNTTVGQLGEAFKYAAPLAGSYRYQLEDVAAALGMMADAGVKGSMSGTALSSIITRLGINTSGARDAIEELGVEFYNSDGSARSLSDVLKELCDATARMDTEQKAALASTVAGQEAQKGLLAILNQGSAAYEELEGRIKNCNGTASDMAQNMESGLGGSLRSLRSSVEGASIVIGEKLAPYIEKAAQKIKEFTQWFQNLDAGTQETIVKMGMLLAAIGPVLSILGKGISVIGNIISAGSKLAGGVKTVISAGSKLTGGIKTVVSVGSKLISGAKLVIGAFTGLNPVVLAVVAAIGAVVGIGVALYKNWDTIKEKAHELGEKISQKWEDVKQWTSDLKDSVVEKWNNIKDGISNAAKNAKEAVAGKFKELKENASARIEELKENASTKFRELKEKASSRIEELKENASTKFRELKENASNRIEELKGNALSRIKELKENSVAKFKELKENASNHIKELKEDTSAKLRELKENAVTRFTEMRENASAKVTEMRENVVTNFTNLKEQAGQSISDLKERWGQHFETAREKIVSEVKELKEKAASNITQFKDSAVQHFKEFRESAVSSLAKVAQTGVEGFGSLRDKGIDAVKNLASTAASRFVEMGTSVHEKFSSVGEKITGTFSKCQEKVKSIVDSIKGFFNFEWKLPKIKLPHFKMTGEFSLNPPSIPHFGVEWYANGGVMTRPTAFGLNPITGNMMAGGEAGAEAIAPITVLQDYIRQAVGERDQRLVSVLTAILAALNRYLPQCAEKQLVLDTGATVGALAAGMNTRLGEISRQDERIK